MPDYFRPDPAVGRPAIFTDPHTVTVFLTPYVHLSLLLEPTTGRPVFSANCRTCGRRTGHCWVYPSTMPALADFVSAHGSPTTCASAAFGRY